jgi:hypothetical protein
VYDIFQIVAKVLLCLWSFLSLWKITSLLSLSVLNLWNISSVFNIVAIFVNIKLRIIFHLSCVVILVTDFRTEFHTPVFNSSLVIIIRPKTKQTFCKDVIFFELHKCVARRKLYVFITCITIPILRHCIKCRY